MAAVVERTETSILDLRERDTVRVPPRIVGKWKLLVAILLTTVVSAGMIAAVRGSAAARDDRFAANWAWRRGQDAFQNGDWATAHELFAQSVALNDRHVGALNSYAWLLATCPDAAHRDGAEGCRLALRAVELANKKSRMYPVVVDTLAAAYAESGDFAKAVATQRLANELFRGPDKTLWEARLARYDAGQPYREPAVP